MFSVMLSGDNLRQGLILEGLNGVVAFTVIG